jgi:hypothetical protein
MIVLYATLHRTGAMTLSRIIYSMAFLTALVAVAWEARLIFSPHF